MFVTNLHWVDHYRVLKGSFEKVGRFWLPYSTYLSELIFWQLIIHWNHRLYWGCVLSQAWLLVNVWLTTSARVDLNLRSTNMPVWWFNNLHHTCWQCLHTLMENSNNLVSIKKRFPSKIIEGKMLASARILVFFATMCWPSTKLSKCFFLHLTTINSNAT